MTASQEKIIIRDLSKRFDVYRHPKDLFVELLTGKKRHVEYWGLRNVTFNVGQGEVVGIMGRNGAGKSTLLKILTGTQEKTSGTIEVNGRIAAILELGTGFSDDRTGRENIFIGGLFLGMSRSKIAAKLDSIIEFSELGEFIDRPFKTYSSGMKARLTFSTAISVDPDILIIDEALSVGDVKFQRKCFEHMERLRAQGMTILLVSHDARSISHLCDRVILLDKGRVAFDGPPREGVKEYHRMLFQEEVDKVQPSVTSNANTPLAKEPNEARYGTRQIEIEQVQIETDDKLPRNSVNCGSAFSIVLNIVAHEDIEQLGFGFRLTTVEGSDIYGINSTLLKKQVPAMKAGETSKVVFSMKNELAPGRYFLTVSAAKDSNLMYDRRADVLVLDVVGPFVGYDSSLVDLKADLALHKTHDGCDLMEITHLG